MFLASRSLPCLVCFVVLAVAATPSRAVAQSGGFVQDDVSASPGILRETRVPRVTIGASVCTESGGSGRASLLSVELPLTRLASIESETIWREPGSAPFRTFTTGANFLFRGGNGRVSAFAGGGGGLQWTRLTGPLTTTRIVNGRVTVYHPSAPRDGAFVDLLGGMNLRVASRVTAFAGLRTGTAPEDDLRGIAGVRVGIGSRVIRDIVPIKPATPVLVLAAPAVGTGTGAGVGTRVTLTGLNGRRQDAELVSLSESTVVVRHAGGTVSMPLSEVLRIQKVSHEIRNGAVAGLAIGLVHWWGVCGGGCGEPIEALYGKLLISSMWVGGGTGVGALVHAAHMSRNLLYKANR